VKPNVKSYMTGSPVCMEVDASALAALDLMVDHGIRHLPVVDRARRVVGVLSFDDLRAAFPVAVSLSAPPSQDERPLLRDIAVGEVMTYEPVTAVEGDPLEVAAQTMLDRRIGCLPVVDADGGLLGILSESDLLHALVTALWAERRIDAGSPSPSPSPAPRSLADTLREERDRISAQLEAYERIEQSITESERDTPLDSAELGADRTDADLTETLSDLAFSRLRAIEHALERAERGELGRCESCGGEIPEGRLRALPSATLCVRCARVAEAGQR
jgi:acetoin utilization protein AcuB